MVSKAKLERLHDVLNNISIQIRTRQEMLKLNGQTQVNQRFLTELNSYSQQLIDHVQSHWDQGSWERMLPQTQLIGQTQDVYESVRKEFRETLRTIAQDTVDNFSSYIDPYVINDLYSIGAERNFSA